MKIIFIVNNCIIKNQIKKKHACSQAAEGFATVKVKAYTEHAMRVKLAVDQLISSFS